MNPSALELREVSLAFRGMPVLERVNLTVQPGHFIAIIGPNGGGKSVLLRVIAGLLKPDEGVVRVLGRSPANARGQIAYVPQYAAFDFDYPIRAIDVVLMGRLRRGTLMGRFSAKDRELAEAALEEMGVGHLAQRQVGKLSGGQLQRVLIARGLAVDAPVFLLDEPTANLDASIVNDFYARLGRLQGERTVILVSHDIGIISRYVQSVACLNRRLHYHDTREISRELIEEAYGCPVDFITHRHTHLVLDDHPREAS
jgi:zinc transport system ATP-binding protein